MRRGPDGQPIVVIGFPYDPHVVAAVRSIPGRRFDWDTREWWAPLDDWVGVHVRDVIDKFPQLEPSVEIELWLKAVGRRWVGLVTTVAFESKGWFRLRTRAGEVPEELLPGSVEREDGSLLVPFTKEAAASLAEQRGAKTDAAAHRCIQALEFGERVPPARLIAQRGVEGEILRLEVLWDPATGSAFDDLPGAEAAGHTLPPDPWVVGPLNEFLDAHGVEVDGSAQHLLTELRDEYDDAQEAIKDSRATEGPPIPEVEKVLGGTLQPFQWAGVRYCLHARRGFLADEQGLGKTVQALAALEADNAWPAVVICPASMKLVWQREANHWLPHRSVEIIDGKPAVPPTGDITILNYEIVAAHTDFLGRMGPKALIIDESHLVKNPRAKRTQAVRRLANTLPKRNLVLCLSGTPVLNHAEELVSQLRIIGRLDEFGSGARFAKRFQGALSEERLHWHLRRYCFVRRLKSEVLPAAAAEDARRRSRSRSPTTASTAWPSATSSRGCASSPTTSASSRRASPRRMRAERLAQLSALQRIAARGKLARRDLVDRRLPGQRRSRSSCSRATARSRRPCSNVIPTRCTSSAATRLIERDDAVKRFQEPDGPAAHRVRDPRRRAGHHAHARVQRRLPRARVDARDARPGRGPLPSHRPARQRHGLVPARRRTRSTRRWRRSSSPSAGSSPPSPTAASSTTSRCSRSSSPRCARARSAGTSARSADAAPPRSAPTSQRARATQDRR